MAWVNKQKFFNRYLPMFLSVVLVVAAIGTYLVFERPQTAEAAVVVDTTTAGTERTGLGLDAGHNTFNSNSFSTSAGNELILAIAQFSTTQAGTAASITNITGAGLAWHLAKRQNANDGSAEIWYTFAPSQLTSQTATATFTTTDGNCTGAGHNGCTADITIITFSGTDTTGVDGSGAIGATNGCGSASGTPSCSLTTTRNNSWVVGALFNWSNSTAPTVPASQTAFGGLAGSGGDYYWGQRQNAVTPISGTSVTINNTSPTGIDYSEAIVEILPPLNKTGNFVQQGGVYKQRGGKMVVGPKPTVPTYLFSENFDGSTLCIAGGTSNCNNTWTKDGTITTNFAYTTSPAPLEGSNSLLLTSTKSGAGNDIRSSFTAQNTVYFFFVTNYKVFVAANIVFEIDDAGQVNTLFGIDNNNPEWRIHCGSVISGNTDPITQGTTYYVWGDYTKGTGTNAVCNLYYSTTPTKPGSPNITISNGDVSTQASIVQLENGTTGAQTIFDKVRVSASNIGSNPQ